MPNSPIAPKHRARATSWTRAGPPPNRRDNPTIADPFNTHNSKARPWGPGDFVRMSLTIGGRKSDQECQAAHSVRQTLYRCNYKRGYASAWSPSRRSGRQ